MSSVDPKSIASRTNALAPTSADAKSASPASDLGGGTAFKALLDQLEERSRSLSHVADGVRAPGDLAGAVNEARRSIDDAVKLTDELLEAYRARARKEKP